MVGLVPPGRLMIAVHRTIALFLGSFREIAQGCRSALVFAKNQGGDDALWCVDSWTDCPRDPRACRVAPDLCDHGVAGVCHQGGMPGHRRRLSGPGAKGTGDATA